MISFVNKQTFKRQFWKKFEEFFEKRNNCDVSDEQPQVAHQKLSWKTMKISWTLNQKALDKLQTLKVLKFNALFYDADSL